ncbi:MAG: branched-chain amino acid ABC transporter permease [Desulfobulbaceae bacterium]|jgi:branched-chain amino acid transport system permease protein|nr:branched-chain amino acid ABC transporter permease [Desulfobulbaceae bacterium]
MPILAEIRFALRAALWFVFLTFPIMVIKADPIGQTVIWRWRNAVWVGACSFFVCLALRLWKNYRAKHPALGPSNDGGSFIHRILDHSGQRRAFLGILLAAAILFPFFASSYQTNIMITALIYVVLGLGLNIVVGMAGLLDLGFVAFYAIGAYTYALLHLHFGLGFWQSLPLGACLAALGGICLGFPVLRLRGDYLAIVTLGFGEIIRLALENWGEFSQGPSGIANIPRPGFFGMTLSLDQSILFLYFIMIVFVIATIFVVNRLRDSRIGRAWIALREDEIACQAMGIDKQKTKLAAFALGAFWAGGMGVVFAAKTTFINPASFTFLESVIILSIVVLGGMGSIVGVVCGALILVLLPEYLRALSEYRMLAFGAILVLMMIFRPQGLIPTIKSRYPLENLTDDRP